MSASARVRIASVQGGDPPLRELLSDVLGECGYAVEPGGPSGSAELVLLLLGGEPGLKRLVALVAATPCPPVLAILPFADDMIAATALRHGASAVYALGTSLDQLRAAIHALTGGSG